MPLSPTWCQRQHPQILSLDVVPLKDVMSPGSVECHERLSIGVGPR